MVYRGCSGGERLRGGGVMEVDVCPRCGQVVDDTVDYCPRCGACLRCEGG